MEYTLKNGATIIIRQPKTEDAEALIALIQKADSETPFLAREEGEFDVTADQERAMLSSILSNDDEAWFVAEYNGNIVGMCSVGLVRRYLRYRHRAEMAILLLAAYCNLGIGGKLMKECITWCRCHKAEQLELQVVTANERALAMYRGFGFQMTGTIPNALRYKDGTYADEYFMVLKL